MKTTVFLGGGRIAGALLAGLWLAKYPGSLVVYDRHDEKARRLQKLYGVTTESSLERAVANAHLLIIAVRPASVSGLLQEIGRIDHPLIAVSLAAGVPLSFLQRRLGPRVRWARAMPSPACRSGRGLTALAFAHDFPDAAKREIRSLFARVGPVLEISEKKFDAFTVTYSCSHGYHALATLASAAERLGLDRKTALTAAAHALADGIAAWREGNISLDALLHEAATPGGIAARVMETMNRKGYKKVVARGLAAGFSLARKNAERAQASAANRFANRRSRIPR
jgi:pyrroline-5-carboxylate reductase